jgi:DNA adenine methylase
VSFLKWAGGKTSTAQQILRHRPERFSVYYEPMVGAGSVFLKLKPERAVLCDTNRELMNCYEVIRDDVDRLIEILSQHRNSYEHFVAARALDPFDLPPVERAARTIYLNKTCFNGLYRLNKKGHFNVPFGRHRSPNFCDIPTLQRISKQLAGVTLRCCDFEESVADAPPDSFIYFDPPYYHPDRHRKHHYYHPDAFSEDDHRRLAALFRRLDLLGCHLLLSNSDHKFVRELYEGYPIEVIKLRRPINATASGRDGWTEVLIHN